MPALGKTRRRKPIRLNFVIPTDVEPYGQTPEGIPLYRTTKTKVTTKPDYEPIRTDKCQFDHKWLDDTVKDPVCTVCGITGHQKHRKSTTGEELIGQRIPIVEKYEFVFTWEDEGNGNDKLVEYKPPTEKELAEAARAKRRAFLMDRLADALADGEIDLDELTGKVEIIETKQENEEGVKVSAAIAEDFPVYIPVGKWRLSDGSVIQGKKADALEAEAAIADTREKLAAVPEY